MVTARGQIKAAQLKGGADESQLSEFVHWYVHSDTGQSSVVSPRHLKLKPGRDIRTHTLGLTLIYLLNSMYVLSPSVCCVHIHTEIVSSELCLTSSVMAIVTIG